MPGGRPAVRQGEPSPRMVGRGKGMMGTPGGSGGWGAGCGWLAGCPIRGVGVGAGCGRGLAGFAAGRAATTVLRATDMPLRAVEPPFGRAGLAAGFAFFEVVARPFAFERRSELRGAPLPTRRCRSI